MRILALLLSLFASLPLLAKDVYKWTTPDGVVIYSDTYQPGAQRLRVSGSKGAPSSATDGDSGQLPGGAAGVGYQDFQILQPEDNETIRSNEGKVPVSLMLSPGLAQDNAIQIYVDGSKLQGDLKSTQFTLNELNRGTHSLEAKVVDSTGVTLISAPRISFHLRKASIIKP